MSSLNAPIHHTKNIEMLEFPLLFSWLVCLFFLQSLFEHLTVSQVDDKLSEEGYHCYRLRRLQIQSGRDPQCLNRQTQLLAEGVVLVLMESLVHHCEDDKYRLNKSDERHRGSGMIQRSSEDSPFGRGWLREHEHTDNRWIAIDYRCMRERPTRVCIHAELVHYCCEPRIEHCL